MPTKPDDRHRARPRRAAMLVHAYYAEDARVRREAEALVSRGWKVDVFGLRREGESKVGDIAGVRSHRLPVGRHQGAGIGTYLREYLEFFVLAGAAVTRAHRRTRYDVVQVHTIPDFLAFAALPLRLTGVPLVLDLHEAMPEFFRMRFPGASNRLVHAGLRAQERASIAVASAVITVNDSLAARLAELGISDDKVTVMNTPDLRIFDRSAHPTRDFMADGALRLVYAGAVTPVYELDVLIKAAARLHRDRPDLQIQLDIYGRGDAEVDLKALAQAEAVENAVTFHGRIPLEQVPAAIAAADIGIAPTRRDPMTDFSLSTKVFEYSAMGKPVVASRLPTVEHYFPADTLTLYTPGDANALAAAVAALVDDPPGRVARAARTAERAAELGWERQAARYVALMETLADRA
jgi:glycosyltransferase involved in cell wall biosynthesis